MDRPIVSAEATSREGATVVSTKAQLKVGDTIMTVGNDGKPVTLTVISVPKTGNRKERRKARAEARHG